MKPIIIAICLLVVGIALLGFGIYKESRPEQYNPFESSSSTPTTNTPIISPVPIQANKQIEVPMKIPWTDTGIQIQAGQLLKIVASGRGVWKNVVNSYPSPYEECGPNGTPPIDKTDYYSNINFYQCPQAYKGALIGRIGNGLSFPVGSSFTNQVNESGVLYLGINDMSPENGIANWADNTGSFKAQIKVD